MRTVKIAVAKSVTLPMSIKHDPILCDSQATFFGHFAYPNDTKKIQNLVAAYRRLNSHPPKSAIKRNMSETRATKLLNEVKRVIVKHRLPAGIAYYSTYHHGLGPLHFKGIQEYVDAIIDPPDAQKREDRFFGAIERNIETGKIDTFGRSIEGMTGANFVKRSWRQTFPVLHIALAVMDQADLDPDYISSMFKRHFAVRNMLVAAESHRLKICEFIRQQNSGSRSRLRLNPAEMIRFVPDPIPVDLRTVMIAGQRYPIFDDLE